MSFLSKYSRTKNITFSEIQVELITRILKNRLIAVKESKIDNFENIENEYSIQSLLNIIQETNWNNDRVI